jgi:hypothetical protein
MQHNHSGNTETNCDINAGPCAATIEHDNIQVILDIAPKPVKPMSELLFSVILKEGDRYIMDAEVSLDLTMPGMFMGTNRPVLSHVKDGRYEGKGVIPVCPHGGKLWKAEVTVAWEGRSATANFLFQVK